jgi:hypothetical protein
MNEPLRPSSLGEILDRTANLYRSRFLVFFGIAAVPAAVVLGFGGLMVALIAWAGNPGSGGAGLALVGLGAVALVLLAMPLMLGANALSGAALCEAGSTLSLGGTITIASAFKAVWKRGWAYVGLYLLLMVILFGAPMAVWMMLILGIGLIGLLAGANVGVLPGALMLLTFVGLAVYFVWMLVRLCLAYPIAVVEKAPVGTALKRAWGLSEGSRWRMVVLFLLGIALSWVGSLVLMVPLILAVAWVPALRGAQNSQLAGTVMLIGMYGSSFAVQALTMPVYAIALVLFYYDQRVRREGFDIELLMRQAGMVSEPVAQPEPAQWMPAGQSTVPAGTENAALAAAEPDETRIEAGAETDGEAAGSAAEPERTEGAI